MKTNVSKIIATSAFAALLAIPLTASARPHDGDSRHPDPQGRPDWHESHHHHRPQPYEWCRPAFPPPPFFFWGCPTPPPPPPPPPPPVAYWGYSPPPPPPPPPSVCHPVRPGFNVVLTF